MSYDVRYIWGMRSSLYAVIVFNMFAYTYYNDFLNLILLSHLQIIHYYLLCIRLYKSVVLHIILDPISLNLEVYMVGFAHYIATALYFDNTLLGHRL